MVFIELVWDLLNTWSIIVSLCYHDPHCADTVGDDKSTAWYPTLAPCPDGHDRESSHCDTRAINHFGVQHDGLSPVPHRTGVFPTSAS